MPDAIRVAVVDDHPVFRMGMAGLLDSLEGISVVGQAADAAAALALPLAEIDVVLMDLHLGEDSGIDTTREIVRRDPDARVLVVTMREDDDAVASCMRVGARGYLLKGASPDHEGEERADRWSLDPRLTELARRWRIDPDRDLRRTAVVA